MILILGYSADDSVWCRRCLREIGGLSPQRPDHDGKDIKTLFAADPAFQDERCGYCDRRLVDLLGDQLGRREPPAVTALAPTAMPEPQAAINILLRGGTLTPRRVDFLVSIGQQHVTKHRLSEKQLAVLVDIWTHFQPVEAPRPLPSPKFPVIRRRGQLR